MCFEIITWTILRHGLLSLTDRVCFLLKRKAHHDLLTSATDNVYPGVSTDLFDPCPSLLCCMQHLRGAVELPGRYFRKLPLVNITLSYVVICTGYIRFSCDLVCQQRWYISSPQRGMRMSLISRPNFNSPLEIAGNQRSPSHVSSAYICPGRGVTFHT